MPYIGKKPADIIATVIDTTTGTFSGDLTVDTSTLYVDSANNRVGVGTVSPSSPLHISLPSSGTDVEGWRVSSGGGGILYVRVDNAASANPTWEMNVAASEQLAFGIGASEAMRIDSSRNLLVGGTSAAEAGSLTVYPTGIVQARVIGNNAIIADRTSTDGEIIDFRKDGSTVGSIGTQNGSDFYITGTASDDTGLRFQTNEIVPVNDAGGNRDNAIDLGKSNIRFKDLYLSTTAYATTLAGVSDTNTFIRFEGSDVMTFRTGNAERMRIDSSGNVGIGVTPTNTFSVGASGTVTSRYTSTDTGAFSLLRFENTGSIVLSADHGNTQSNSNIVFQRDGATESMRIDSSGNVGIGIVPQSFSKLQVKTATDRNVAIFNNAAGATIGGLTDAGASTSLRLAGAALVMTGGGGSGSEHMRIDSSGNLVVGKSAVDLDVAGVEFRAGSYNGMTNDGGVPLYLNRLTSDGGILEFRKDGTTVGSIGNNGTELFIGTPSGSGGYIRLQSGGIVPATSTGANSDGTMQIGTASGRFSDLYLSGGVYLGGTGSANYLDDYEEGTWTPTHGGNNMIQNGGNASYVKVGKVVTVLADVTSVSGSSTTNQIGGLPFTALNPHGSAYVSFTSGSNSPAGAYVDTTILNFMQNASTTGANIYATERVIFVAVYYTSA
jgi:hypothetical protein